MNNTPIHPQQAGVENVVCAPNTVKLSGQDQFITSNDNHKTLVAANTAIVVLATLAAVLFAAQAYTKSQLRRRVLRGGVLFSLLAIAATAAGVHASTLGDGTRVKRFVGCAYAVHGEANHP